MTAIQGIIQRKQPAYSSNVLLDTLGHAEQLRTATNDVAVFLFVFLAGRQLLHLSSGSQMAKQLNDSIESEQTQSKQKSKAH